MNMARAGIRRGDVVIVDLVGSVGSEMQNHSIGQGRPCVVVKNDRINASSPVTIVVPVTDVAAYKPHLPIHVAVIGADQGPLKKPSVIDCGQVRSIDRKERIRRNLGAMPEPVMKRVNNALRVSLAS